MLNVLNILNLHYQLNNDHELVIEELSVKKGESLLVVGDNASGKSVLAQILIGKITDFSGEVQLNVNHTSLSFELEADTLAYDREHDNSDYIEGGVDWGRSAQDIIMNVGTLHYKEKIDRVLFSEITELLDIKKLLDKPFKILSTGETRKILMARALMSSPELLILDEPYAGLDINSQAHLTEVLNQLILRGISIILFDFYHQSLPSEIKNIIYLQEGEIKLSGNRTAIVNSRQWQSLVKVHYSLPHHLPDCINYQHIEDDIPLVHLTNVSVNFETKQVFTDLSWQFNQGEHWRVIGPNGCGKSTLLSMICGDSTKAYGKDIWLFGTKRGSGESIWDIKRHYGVVSAQLHRDYRVSTTLLQTVLSGFFDSIGLYDRPSENQINIAKQWLVLLGLADKQKSYFNELSYGEQRLALIARAVVKLPLVLILDEPCQGLDNNNRAKVLALIDYIAAHSKTHILFVSHDVRDTLNCLTNELEFIEGIKGYQVTSKTVQRLS